MCAAPGSKTVQLLELLHVKKDPIPSGFIIANEINTKKSYMLVHQAKTLGSPCLTVINHDSVMLPNFKMTLSDGSLEQVRIMLIPT